MARSKTLSNVMRAEIIAACSLAMFGEREKKFQQSKTDLADALYNKRFGKEEPEVLKLSSVWFDKTDQLAISCDGFHYSGENENNLSHGADVSCYLKMSKERVQPRNWDGELSIEAKHQLYKQAQAIVKERHAMLDAKAEFSDKIRSIVWSASTIAKLKEIWPEGAKFFPADELPTTALVPFTAIKQVNKALGLP